MLDESICHFDGNSLNPGQTPNHAASYLGLHCLLMTLLDGGVQVRIG